MYRYADFRVSLSSVLIDSSTRLCEKLFDVGQKKAFPLSFFLYTHLPIFLHIDN